MSATSSSPPASPTAMKPQHNCIECKRLKRACDKKFPCGKCAKAGKICEYKDPSDDGLYGPISSAKHPQSVAFGTLLEILHTKPKVKDAVEMYFNGVNTWFTIIERASFEEHLESNWDNLSAEVSVMALCMALIALPADQKQSKGMGDPAYSSVKATLSVVQSKVPLSVQLLQAELLVALYEFSNSMPQQAYLSLGRCYQMTRMFGWHDRAFWSSENQVSLDRLKELKLYSILWWAMVYVDCLLNVAYQDQVYPMHTTDVALASIIRLPEFFDQYFLASLPFQFAVQNQVLQDPNSHLIEGIIFPEANSAWYLSHVLQRLSSPTLPGIDSKTLSEEIWQHARKTASAQWRAGDRNAAVGTDFIALMKLNQPALFGGIDFIPMPNPALDESVLVIRRVIGVIHGKAGRLAESEDRLNMGAVDPCWAFAMCYASLLLISHGEGTLQDAAWRDKVDNMRRTLDKVSKRWKIAERYCEMVKIALDNRRRASYA